MLNRMRTVMSIIAMLVLMLTATITASANEDATTSVNGQFFLQGIICDESPVGFCGEGTAAGDIQGDVYIVLTTVTFTSPIALDYTSTIEISGPGGTLYGNLNATNVANLDGNGQLLFWDNFGTVTITSGTGIYNGATGSFDIAGIIDVNDFETDSFSGTLTLPNNGNNAANGNRGFGNNGN